MIIITGSKGFIGKKFLEKLGEDVVTVEKNDSWHFRQTFSDWRKVKLILHQGAISDTTCTNLKAFHHFNVCLLYTSPSPRDVEEYRMPSSA